MRHGAGCTVASPAATLVEGDTPRQRDRGGERSRSRPGARRGRRASPGHHPRTTRSGSGGAARRRARRRGPGRRRRRFPPRPAPRGRTCGRRAPASRGRRRRAPRGRGRRAPRAARPSPWPRRRARRADPAWASPMFVITPTVGRAIAQSAAMSPCARAPISSTSASVAVGAAEQGERHARFVVVRARAGVHVELGRQGGGDQVLGAGLPGRAGDADDGGAAQRRHAPPVRAGQARRRRRRPARRAMPSSASGRVTSATVAPRADRVGDEVVTVPRSRRARRSTRPARGLASRWRTTSRARPASAD